ncbi:2,3-diaminopropionate biosynthesis protein SbnA [Lysobacter hankyongensis]|uniref:N-(2-amino-2-carboxyethyl)-L-glutamate synthase n=1 Tax=Lysobacter hankyongensis TaxID=1176535 RepID=A0ABP9AJP8_9GAMM
MLSGVLHTIGDTPLVTFDRLRPGEAFRIHGKLESFNPSGSIKDRTSLQIIEASIACGQIGPQTTVVESSSGNFGIGLAQVCLYHGLRFICVVDPKITPQNANILRAYRAELDIVTAPDPASNEFLPARLKRVRELCDSIPDSFWPNQYANLDNPAAHRATMREIVEQLGKAPDYLLCATGTTGSLRGCAEYLREIGAATKVVAVDAVGSVIFGDQPRKRLIPGHGAALVPKLLDPSLVSQVVRVTDMECVIGCHNLLEREALLAGGSSGAIVSALEKISGEIPAGADVVLLLPDRGDRYLDSIYCDVWVERNLGSPTLRSTTETKPDLHYA